MEDAVGAVEGTRTLRKIREFLHHIISKLFTITQSTQFGFSPPCWSGRKFGTQIYSKTIFSGSQSHFLDVMSSKQGTEPTTQKREIHP